MAMALAMSTQAPATAAAALPKMPTFFRSAFSSLRMISASPSLQIAGRAMYTVVRVAAEGTIEEVESAQVDEIGDVEAASSLSETPEGAAPSLPLPQQRIRVKLRAYFADYVDEAVKMVIEAARSTGAGIMGPVPLPTNRRLYCLLRSPHVNKNSMEHFQIKTHKRLIDIKNPNPRTIDALMQLDIPVGVEVEVKL